MTLRSSPSGFWSVTGAGGRPSAAMSFGETKPKVTASERPDLDGARGARGLGRARGARRLRADRRAAPSGSLSTPRTRITSSIRSASPSTSGRCVGAATSASASSPLGRARVTSKPRRVRMPVASAKRDGAPSSAFMRRARRRMGAGRRAGRPRGGCPGTALPRASAVSSARRVGEHVGHVGRVDAALEAVARLGVERVPARRAADAARREVRALEQHAPGRRADLAALAAHHRPRARPGPRRRR